MGVGSLRSPREYDDRLPPDLDSSLNLVIPRFEEPRKKTRASYNNTMEGYRNKVVNYYATQSQNISKFPSETNQNTNPMGGHGGGGSYVALLVAV